MWTGHVYPPRQLWMSSRLPRSSLSRRSVFPFLGKVDILRDVCKPLLKSSLLLFMKKRGREREIERWKHVPQKLFQWLIHRPIRWKCICISFLLSSEVMRLILPFFICLCFPSAICNPVCLNGATCTRPGECQCTPGFKGRRCETGKLCFACNLTWIERQIKGSMERSSLPCANFLIFARNRPWKSEDHPCMLFFIERSRERLEKSERMPPVSWRPWATGVQPRSTVQIFMPLSDVEERLSSQFFFFVGYGCHLASKSLSWPTMPISNKKQKFEQRSMTSECVRTDSILPRCAGCENGRCKQSIFSLSIFIISVEWLSL